MSQPYEQPSNAPETDPPRVRAAQYVRMSTEHQQYSTANQEDVIREYADRRGFEIVRTYADEGKSGLNVAGRESLRRMIADVQEGRADYAAILVYDAAEDIPTSATFRSRFGSLFRAYGLAGYTPDRDYQYVEINRHLRETYPDRVDDVVRRLDAAGASVTRDATTDLLLINGEYSASMVLSRCRQTPAGSLRWWLRIDERIAPDITILVRMDPEIETPADFYLFPLMDLTAPKLLLCETNGAYLDTYQFANLDYFASLAARTNIEVAA